jgi:hypothetical protein
VDPTVGDKPLRSKPIPADEQGDDDYGNNNFPPFGA